MTKGFFRKKNLFAVSLTWDAVKDNVGVKSYDVYRDSVIIGNTSATTYNTSALQSATTYKLNVRAKDSAGNTSSPSNSLTVTTLQTDPVPTPTPTPTPMPTTATKALGYYAAWSAYSGFTPDKIDASTNA